MSVFVSLAELKTYLGDAPASDDALLTQLIDDVEALFASETGRLLESFTDASDLVEVLDGTGSPDLYLDYPVAEDGLISVTLGYSATSPDETLDITDPTVLVYGAGSRRLTRVDGGVFGRSGHRRCVIVTYSSVADLPDSAKLAIKSVAAMAYRRRGSEAEKSETIGNFYSHTMVSSAATDDPFWRAAVTANARGQLV
jgi:hypothetical protein